MGEKLLSRWNWRHRNICYLRFILVHFKRVYFLFFKRFFLRRFRNLCLFIIFLRLFNVLMRKIPSSKKDRKVCHHGATRVATVSSEPIAFRSTV